MSEIDRYGHKLIKIGNKICSDKIIIIDKECQGEFTFGLYAADIIRKYMLLYLYHKD